MNGPSAEAREGDTIMYLGIQPNEGWDVVLHLRTNRAVAGIRVESGIRAGYYKAV